MKHPPLDAVAAAYVPLILAIQRHSETYVDFYFGPEEWRARAKRVPRVPVESLLTQTRDLLARTRAAAPSMRRRALERQLIAVDAYLRILGGAHIPWREEARLLFDADPGVFAAQQYRASVARLRSLLPGRGTLSSRLRAYLGRFSIPPDRLRAVIGASLEATRERTVRLIDLPRGERLTISFVRGKPWAAWNRYMGNYRSRIQVNLDMSSHAADVLTLVAHEGYPGHHTFYSLRDQFLVRARRWHEFVVCPVFSPQSLIGEGAAGAALSIIMTEAERQAFVRDTLMPLGRIAGDDVPTFFAVVKLLDHLRGVGAEAARRLLEEGRGDDEVARFLIRYGFTRENVRTHLQFFRDYRTYVCAYDRGERLVSRFIGNGANRAARYFGILCRPLTPSALLRHAPTG